MLTAPDFVVIGLRALAFIAIMQAAGNAIFLSLFGAELVRSRKLIVKVTLATAVSAIFLVVLQHVLEPARMTASFSGVWDGALQAILLESNAGTARSIRLLGLALVIWSMLSTHRFRAQLGLIGAVFVIASFTLMGHTAADEHRWLLAGMLFVHLLVAAFWFGALAAFWLSSTRDSAAVNAAVVREFSAIASWLVPMILIAGIVLAWFLLPDFAALLAPYGRFLIAKLAAFIVLMGLAIWNKQRLGPAIEGGHAAALVIFRRSVAGEWLLIAGVLALTAVMTGLFGPD